MRQSFKAYSVVYKIRLKQIEFGKCSAFVSIFHWLRENTKFSRYHLCYGCCFCCTICRILVRSYVCLLLNKRQSQETGHICIYFHGFYPYTPRELFSHSRGPSLEQHMSWNKFYVHLLTSANNEHPLTSVTWLSPTLSVGRSVRQSVDSDSDSESDCKSCLCLALFSRNSFPPTPTQSSQFSALHSLATFISPHSCAVWSTASATFQVSMLGA